MEKQESRGNIYLKIFRSTFYTSAFSFGGGYAIVPLLQKKFVEELGWISREEVLDLTAISQSAPGPIAVNAAMMLGYQVKGVSGALVAMVGTVLPPLIIISIISRFYVAFRANKVIALVLMAMASAVTAVVVDVVMTMLGRLVKSRKILAMLLFGLAFTANFVFRVRMIYIILFCGVAGLSLGRVGRQVGKELL